MRSQHPFTRWLMIVLMTFMAAVVSISAWQIVSPVPAYAADCDHNCGSSGGSACETGCDLCHMSSCDSKFHCKKHMCID